MSLALGFSLAMNHVFPQMMPAKASETPLVWEDLSSKVLLDESGKYIAEDNTLRVIKPEFVEIQEEPKPVAPTPEPPKATVQKVTTPKIQMASVEQWRPLVAKYFPANQVDNALKIMACESKGNPNSVSRTNDHGLMQIHNGLAAYGQQIYNPEFNIRLAYTNYYARRGWQPWSCRRKVRLN